MKIRLLAFSAAITLLPVLASSQALFISDVTVTEGTGGTTSAVFNVVLNPANPTKTVTVNFATAAGTALANVDYQTISGTLSFPPGQALRQVTVQVINDALNENTETFFVNLSSPKFASIGDGQGVGTITDNDPMPAVSIMDLGLSEGTPPPASGTTRFDFSVMLSTPSGRSVTVPFSTSDGSAHAPGDYTAIAAGTVSIPAGQISRPASVFVNRDGAGEPNETFLVNLGPPSGATLNDGLAVGTIVNDDGPPPTLSINDVSVLEDAGTATFTMTASPAPAQTVTVSFATQDGTAVVDSDYQAASGTLTFAAGQTSRPITVIILDDEVIEPNETFTVNLSSPDNAVISDPSGVGTITNDDARWGVTPIFSGIPDISGPAGYVAGDLDGDGDLDLVASGD
ncbi:MAG TPA: Calx-beta domain-containing protein, partial [Vicinamibacteria bacterium]|nr:Calx-beta domain-containing protein [Vicinamibacteria bacterium]